MISKKVISFLSIFIILIMVSCEQPTNSTSGDGDESSDYTLENMAGILHLPMGSQTFTLKSDGTGSSFGNDYNGEFTWEITEVEITLERSITRDATIESVPCIKITMANKTDIIELEIVDDNGIFELKDISNNVVYQTDAEPLNFNISNNKEVELFGFGDLNSTKEVTWESSDPLIATVDASSGKVKGIKLGTATMTATTTDGSKTDNCEVTVILPVEAKSMFPETNSCEVKLDGTVTLRVPTYNSQTITVSELTWVSSDISIATVDAAGVVTAVAAGIVTLTASYNDDPRSTQVVTCTVYSAPTDGLVGTSWDSWTHDKQTMYKFTDISTYTINGSVGGSYDYFEDNNVVWINKEDGTHDTFTLSDDKMELTDGKSQKWNSFTVSIATDLKIYSNSGKVGRETKFSTTFTPKTTTNTDCTWASSDTAIATVDDNGVVTGVAEGSATITAVTKDGSSITAISKITISAMFDIKDGYEYLPIAADGTWQQSVNGYPAASLVVKDSYFDGDKMVVKGGKMYKILDNGSYSSFTAFTWSGTKFYSTTEMISIKKIQ